MCIYDFSGLISSRRNWSHVVEAQLLFYSLPDLITAMHIPKLTSYFSHFRSNYSGNLEADRSFHLYEVSARLVNILKLMPVIFGSFEVLSWYVADISSFVSEMSTGSSRYTA